MYKFEEKRNGKANKYSLSIEPKTHLCVLQQYVNGEEYPRYIRMTSQQIDGIKSMWYKGNFASRTIPCNRFSYNKETDLYIFACPEEGQRITLHHDLIKEVFQYLDKHQSHIARFDAQFRSRR